MGMRTSRLYAASVSLVAILGFWTVATSARDIGVTLSGAQETPPVQTSASGTGTISIGDDRSVTGRVMTKGIEGTAAHIHLGAVGKSGPPIITLTKGADGTWSVPADARLTDEQFASFNAGDLYINVHSAEHKAGEIRGQLKP